MSAAGDHSGNDVAKKDEETVKFSGNADGTGEAEVKVVVPSSAAQPRLALFERSNGSIINPRYDSALLENYFLECAFPEARHRFRFCLVFVAALGLVWGIYAHAVGVNAANVYLIGGLVLCAVSMATFGVTFLGLFEARYRIITVAWALVAVVLALAPFAIVPAGLTYVALMGLCLKLLLIIYTVVPAPLFVCVLLGLFLSVLFELLLALRYEFPYLIAPRLLVQLGMHALGIHLHLMSQVRRRSTFIKLCESARSKKEIKVEQKANREMIRSLMPDKVADEVMAGEQSKKKGGRSRLDDDDDERMGSDDDSGEHGRERSDSASEDSASEAEPDDVEQSAGARDDQLAKTSVVTFRKFHVSQMENVSILYADIVGFTKMSSNKTAPHLVFLLNDLFGRFDKLCELNGNEKIATLGDCYYCVAGCPDSVDNHAERCVEMGRSMCLAIQQFDEDHNEEVNMRVGVHTGMVICGIVGTRRFKFDVWSNDVNLANEMESSGQAGKVHISESTLEFVKDLYDVEPGEPVPDIRKIKVLIEYFDEVQKCYAIKHTQDEADIETYFILNRKDGKPPVALTDSDRADAATQPPPTSGADPDEASRLAADPDDSAPSPGSGDAEKDGGGRRESSDSALVEDMRAERPSAQVFYFPPVNRLSLNFLDASTERRFRRLGLRLPRRAPAVVTLASPRVTPLADALLFAGVLLLASAACLAAGGGLRIGLQIGVLLVSVLLAGAVLLPLLLDRCCRPGGGFLALYARLFAWLPRNVVGALLLLLPAAAALALVRPCDVGVEVAYSFGVALLLLFAAPPLALFTMLSFWTKLGVTLVAGAAALVLVMIGCPDGADEREWDEARNATLTAPVFADAWPNFRVEFALAMALILVAVTFLNRKFELSYRLGFDCDQVALLEKKEINNAKRQADWLLENIIPHYIIADLRSTQKYSQHMKDVGVVFATLSNFSQFYDEQFQGGREMLRVLNEIFADFEHLLEMPRFKDVEKIKTIGACFMAASGLNAAERKKNDEKKMPDAHLYALMDFALGLLETIDDFNKQIFNFDFELKIGYNIGDVFAGVIGTTKLLYDIWGDTVNVASRMYSTGEKARIQVTKRIADRLSDAYEFEYRDMIEVKGKGKMETYLLVRKK